MINTLRLLVITVFSINTQLCFSQTYSGYVKRPEPIDWNRIGRNMNGSIQEANQNREARKAELDRNTQASINLVLEKNVTTTHDVVDYLSKTFQYLVVNELEHYNDLLKNGLIDPENFSTINFNCVMQYNYAIDYCNSIDYKLSLLNRNSESYTNARTQIATYINNSKIKFNTTYQDSRRFQKVTSQVFSITVEDYSGAPSPGGINDTENNRNPSINWFFINIKEMIK